MIANLKKNKKKGFTLVELIVVIAIIAIIAAVAVPTTISYVNKAKISTADQEATELMNTLNTAMTDLALNSDEVTSETFVNLLKSVMPETKNVNKVVVSGTRDAVKITVITDVVSDDVTYSGDASGVSAGEGEYYVNASKTFNWTEMGINVEDTNSPIGKTFSFSNGTWTAA